MQTRSTFKCFLTNLILFCNSATLFEVERQLCNLHRLRRTSHVFFAFACEINVFNILQTCERIFRSL